VEGQADELAKGLKRARERAHLSQRKLATKAGLDASYIAMLEGGKRKPSTEAIEKLADALGMPSSLLLLLCAEKADLRGIQAGESRNCLNSSSQPCGRVTVNSTEPVRWQPGRLVSVRRLGQLLGLPPSVLQAAADSADRYYRSFQKRLVKNGRLKLRQIDHPTGLLEMIQKRIKERILATFTFPEIHETAA